MINIHRDNRVFFWLLIGGVVLNILWSLRLELQAKNKTAVDIYHHNLNQNADTLIGLEEFLRRADEISIKTNDGKMLIEMVKDKDRLDIGAGDNEISIGRLDRLGNGIYLFTRDTSGSTYMIQTSKGIHLNLGDDNKPFHLNMSRDKELVEIRHRGSFFQVGEAPVEGEIYQGVFMGEKNYATLGINKDEGIGLRSLKEINLALGEQSDNSEPFHFNMSRDEELIEIRHRGSFFQVGEAPVEGEIYQGVFMGEKNYATLGINKDEGIGLITKKTIKLEAQSELSIVADGDINIRSKNGVVKINGKKIHMNKENSQSSGTSNSSSPEDHLEQSYEKDRNSFQTITMMQTSLRSQGFYNGAVDGNYGPNTKKALQRFLKKEGFYKGMVDGQSGEALKDAIKQYQKSKGLKITGHIDLETANAMQRQNIE